MDQNLALVLGSQMLTTAAVLAAPILLTSLVIGLIVSVIQVVTQVQEMTLTFVPKIIAAVVTVLVLGGWMIDVLVNFAKNMFAVAAGS